MYVADAHQSGDVRFMRLSGQRIAKEEDRVDPSFGNSAADDQIAAVRTVSDSFDFQSELLGKHLPRVAGRDEHLLTKEIDVLANEFQHQGLLLIVSDECDHGFLVGHVFNVRGGERAR